MSVARRWLAPVRETRFPSRAHFLFRIGLGFAEDHTRGNLPVPPKPSPHLIGQESADERRGPPAGAGGQACAYHCRSSV